MDILISHNGDNTVIKLCGSITSVNASEFEKNIMNEPADNRGLVLDMGELEFISSAGLRVVLALKKRCNGIPFKIINTNAEVKAVFDVTGFSEIMDVHTLEESAVSAKTRKITLSDYRKIGSFARGDIYRIDDETVLKLFNEDVDMAEAEREKALSKKAVIMGLPSAVSYEIVECDGRWGLIFEFVNSSSICGLIRSDPFNTEKYVEMFAETCRQIHSAKNPEGDLPSFKDINRRDLKNVTLATEEEITLLERFIDAVPDADTCVHGDLSIKSIMVQGGECRLVDMGEFSVGTPLFDISRIIFESEYCGPKHSVSNVDAMNGVFGMPQSMVMRILNMFLCRYFGCDSLVSAEIKYPEVKWLYPLAWFRCCTTMLCPGKWNMEKQNIAGKLLREKLIPFIKENC